MFKKMSLSVIGCLIALFAMGNVNAQSAEITVSAAISLKEAFQEMGKLYESENAGMKVSFNFGASGELAKQIEGGAPVDIFASAAPKDMDQLLQKGFVISSSKADFAKNSVVLIQPASSKIEIKKFEDLMKPEIKKVSIGNPQTVPAGRYAQEVLTHFKLWDGVKDRLIFAENVRQVLDYVARNEVDAGIVYLTDAKFKEKEVRIIATAPPESHKPVIYPIGIVKDSKNETSAKAFVSLILSEDGGKILRKYGFEPIRK
jgi:molybdate transport system substrate-binding protein